MSFDPDFHQAADAWLDAGEAEGQGRILLDILHDSPSAAREFAALARVQAVLEIASLPEQERLQRAAKLLRPPLRKKLRRVVRQPALWWGAAAAVVIGGFTWIAAGPTDQSESAQANHTLSPKKNMSQLSTPAPAQNMVSLPPADPAYVELMDALLVPDFEAVDLSLQEAIALLTAKAAALDSNPLEVTVAELPEGLPEKRVHLKLKYQPASVLVKLIALQTGMKVQATGQSYHLSSGVEYDRSDVDYRVVNLQRWDSFLESQGLLASAAAVPGLAPGGSVGDASSNVEDFRMALLATLHEMPASVEIWDGAKSSDSSPALRVGASKKLNAMLELLLAGPEAPGTLTYDLRLVLFKNHAAVERMFNNNRIETAGIGGPALWNEESLPRLLKFLAEDSDVKLQASPTLRIAPGGEGVMSMQDSRHDIPFEDSNWTGQVCTIESHPAGGKTTINLNLKTQLAAANGGISTQELSNKTTLVLGSTFTAGGIINTEGEHMVFITARLPGAVPFGIVVTDQPGFLRSPYALGSGMIDVVGIPQGTKVKCPYTGQVFRIPE